MRRTWPIIFLLVISTLNITFSQIVIKEKVKINPNNRSVTFQPPEHTPCGPWIISTDYYNPWQVIWNSSYISLDPYQQFFNNQGNAYEHYSLASDHYYDVKITEGTEYCQILKDGYTDPISGEFIEQQVIGNELINIPGEELIGTGIWFGTICQPHQKQYPSFYGIIIPRDLPQGTNLTIIIRDLTTGGEPINYHTRIEVPIMLINNNTNLDTLSHYLKKVLDIKADLPQYSPYCYYCGGAIPSSVTFSVEVIQGQEYGEIYDSQNDILSSSFSNIYTIRGNGSLFGDRFKFVADGRQPDNSQAGLVKIKFTPSDASINTVECSFYIKHNDIKPVAEGINIEFDKPEIEPGDTTLIIIRKGNTDGILEDYPPGTDFEVAILNGCEGGQILVGDSLGTYFFDVQQPISFVASDTLNSDSAIVKLRVGTPQVFAGKVTSVTPGSDYKNSEKNSLMKKGTNSNKYSPTENLFCFGGNTVYDDFMDKEVKIKKETILLGESKYYQAKFNFVKGEFVIEEIKPDEKGIPHQKTGTEGEFYWVTDEKEWGFDIWGDKPVTTIGSDKPVVYWEKRKPIWGTNPVKILEPGLIRVIGRYWEKGKSYKVKLTTSGVPDSWPAKHASIEIEVKKPSKLLTPGQSPTYAKTKDVHDSVINIDSLCIYFGGMNGIPPQYLKGHIYQESAKTNFGGEIGWGFAPSFRYEPYTAQTWKGVLKDMKTNPFYITAITNVNPPNHQHVKIIPYFSGDTITVWQIVAEHSQLLQDGSTDETKLYGVRTHSDTMNYNPYNTIQKKYHGFFEELKDVKVKIKNGSKRFMTLAEKADSTNKRMIQYLRDEFTDEVGTKGMKNMIAQTRIASSYGYFQPLYTTAISKKDTWKYPENADNPPENLNENNIVFPMASRREREYLENGLKGKSKNNWDIGFEEALVKYIFENWNKDKKYPISVMYNSNKFLPQ